MLDKLKTVSMTRSGTTQTRTFVYTASQQLQSATHPESGTNSHTFNADGMATRTDAKSARTDRLTPLVALHTIKIG